MITGYNTDVRHGGVLYHVQTEDKGTGNPVIESLIYVGGQVVATKRASYAEVLSDGAGSGEIADRMGHQHRGVIAAIRAGRLDGRVGGLPGDLSEAAGEAPGGAPEPAAAAAPATGTGAPRAPAEAAPPPVGAPPTPAAETVRDAARSLDSDGLDELVLDFLSAADRADEMLLEMSSEDDLAIGSSTRVAFRAYTGSDGRPVVGAEVQVRLISTVGRPRTLAAGETDDAGRLRLPIEIPLLGRGTAALIVTATGAAGSAEIKYLL